MHIFTWGIRNNLCIGIVRSKISKIMRVHIERVGHTATSDTHTHIKFQHY